MSVRGTVTGGVALMAGGLVTSAGDVAGPVAGLPGADYENAVSRTKGWWRAWRAWRARFGLAEVCGSLGAAAGFAAGYRAAGSLVTAAGLATIGEFIGFYGCVGTRTVVAACRATTHLAGWGRLAAGAWHAVTQQLASCAAAEVLDFFVIRPGCLVGAAWLLMGLPGGCGWGLLRGRPLPTWPSMAWKPRRAGAWPGRSRPEHVSPPPRL